jgi:hypothetical protein
VAPSGARVMLDRALLLNAGEESGTFVTAYDEVEVRFEGLRGNDGHPALRDLLPLNEELAKLLASDADS